MDFSQADLILSRAIRTVTPAAQLVVMHGGAVVHDISLGCLDPETCARLVDAETLFDLASVTKLYTSTAFMRLVEKGIVSLDTSLNSVLPEFQGLRPIRPYEDPLDWNKTVSVSEPAGQVDAGRITFRNVLVHNSGLPAWRPLKDQPDAAAAYRMALETFFAYPPGERIVYSDIGLILLGLAVERLAECPLDAAIYGLVTRPLGLDSTCFLPLTSLSPKGNIAPTEFCKWRNRRICGEVHDENAWRLGGVAGHAGMFANAHEVAAFGQSFLDAALLEPADIAEMTRLQAAYDDLRRGIGFALWSPDSEASSNPFSHNVYGHTGFTGTCVWIDPLRELVVALLTNDVYGGREGRGIARLRVQIHHSIIECVDGI